MSPCYHYALLDPRPLPAAECANAALLGPRTQGVEVTEPLLAARCGMGNIDPQHRPDGGATAAIEAALTWPLPPAGTQLVTIRPDADAYGAMAVLGLRAAGTQIDPAMRTRIALIARADRFDHGVWPGPRPMPRDAKEMDEVGLGEQGCGALATGLSNPALSPSDGVAAARNWIAAGVVPNTWRDRAQGASAALFAAWRQGGVKLSVPDPGGIALIEGFAPGALRFGYRHAPVVVAVDDTPRGDPPALWRKISVAQWQTGHVDLVSAAALLNVAEPGWGGSPSIVGSPQGRPCHSPLARVMAVLRICGA